MAARRRHMESISAGKVWKWGQMGGKTETTQTKESVLEKPKTLDPNIMDLRLPTDLPTDAALLKASTPMETPKPWNSQMELNKAAIAEKSS